jgi:hypothetical protein
MASTKRNQREEFPKRVVTKVAERAGYHCSLCNASTSGPGQERDRSVNVGVASHITAASPRGPRRDHDISKEDRTNIDNAIWLCENCGKLIDNDPALYTVDFLRQKKREAEERARMLVAKPVDNLASGAMVPYLVPELPPQGVIGRHTDIAMIARMLEVGTDFPNVKPMALRGMGGIGKTTLAIALGREESIADFFTGGIFWAELGPQVKQEKEGKVYELLKSWITALGVKLHPGTDVPECKRILRSALATQRALLIIDDVWEAADGRHFLVGGPWCRTLITTRELPVAYELATQERTRQVGLLSPESSLQLLSTLAPDVVALDRVTAERLCQKLEFLPLAIKLAGSMLASESGVPSRMKRLLAELIKRADVRLNLVQPECRLGLEESMPPSLRAILGMSVERLNERERERFALLAVFGAEPTWWPLDAAKEVWSCSRDEAEETTAQLIKRGLIEMRGERYWMHSLLHDYAKELEGHLPR